MTTPSTQPPLGRWSADDVHLPDSVQALLARVVGPADPTPAVPESAIEVLPTRLTTAQVEGLAALVGADAVLVEPAARRRRAAGMSYRDLLALRAGSSASAPDAVVLPSSPEQVAAALAWCSTGGVPVVPFGGGTSVVGGVTRVGPPGIVLALDRMADLISIDEVSGTARVGAGMPLALLERALCLRGFTLGHFPQSFERATIGGVAATRSAGQASTGYGRSEDIIEQVQVATPRGLWTAGHLPTSAAGPDLLHLVLGSEGAFGVITEVTVRIRRQPTWSAYEGLMLPSFEAGVTAFRAMAQDGLSATVMRLSDRHETVTSMASGPAGVAGAMLDRYLSLRGVSDGCLAILGWEGRSAPAMRARRRASWRLLREAGAVRLGSRAGAAWQRSRFTGPRLRDSLLDQGYLVETFETATTWSGLPELHGVCVDGVRSALRESGGQPYVMAHVSHVYETGASVYVTVVDRAGTNPAGRWMHAKAAVMQAIVSAGGTITHHHAVGRDHAPWLVDEVGEIGLGVVEAVRRHLDPARVLNAGLWDEVHRSGQMGGTA